MLHQEAVEAVEAMAVEVEAAGVEVPGEAAGVGAHREEALLPPEDAEAVVEVVQELHPHLHRTNLMMTSMLRLHLLRQHLVAVLASLPQPRLSPGPPLCPGVGVVCHIAIVISQPPNGPLPKSRRVKENGS